MADEGGVLDELRAAILAGEQAAIEHWQTKRDRGKRGIVEIVEETI